MSGTLAQRCATTYVVYRWFLDDFWCVLVTLQTWLRCRLSFGRIDAALGHDILLRAFHGVFSYLCRLLMQQPLASNLCSNP